MANAMAETQSDIVNQAKTEKEAVGQAGLVTPEQSPK